MLSLGYYIVDFLLYRVFFIISCIFIRLFNGALSVSDYMASNIRVTGELDAMNLYTNLLYATFS